MANGDSALGTIGKGAATGAAIGSIIPGVGTAAGAIGGAIFGLGQTIAGGVQRRKAQDVFPSSQDPNVLSFLNEIRAKRRSFETGAAFSGISNQLQQTQESALGAAVRRARTVGEFATIAGRLTRGTQNALATLGARAQEQGAQILALEGRTVGDISQRELELNLLRNRELEARAARNLQFGTSAVAAGTGRTGLFDAIFGAAGTGEEDVETPGFIPGESAPGIGGTTIGPQSELFQL